MDACMMISAGDELSPFHGPLSLSVQGMISDRHLSLRSNQLQILHSFLIFRNPLGSEHNVYKTFFSLILRVMSALTQCRIWRTLRF